MVQSGGKTRRNFFFFAQVLWAHKGAVKVIFATYNCVYIWRPKSWLEHVRFYWGRFYVVEEQRDIHHFSRTWEGHGMNGAEEWVAGEKAMVCD